MNDMRAVIVPKSDQINSDDLIAGPLTITITEVSIRPGTEQPVSINFDGDGGKPYKPCKSMARVMVTCWGADGRYGRWRHSDQPHDRHQERAHDGADCDEGQQEAVHGQASGQVRR
jgi:hypothetical protein